MMNDARSSALVASTISTLLLTTNVRAAISAISLIRRQPRRRAAIGEGIARHDRSLK
jgi:hypothetical protein